MADRRDGRTQIFPVKPARVQAAETPGDGLAAPLVIAAVIVAALYFGREILIPIAIAVLLSFVIGPLVALLRKLRLGRLPSVGVAVLLLLAVVAGLGGLIGMQLADLSTGLPRYQRTIAQKAENLKAGPLGDVAGYLRSINHQIQQAGAPEQKPEEKPETKRAAPPAVQNPDKPVLVEMRDREPGPVELAEKVLAPVLSPLATLGIVFVVLLFILVQREDLRDRMIRLVGSSDLHRTTVAMDDAALRLSRFFLVQLALNAGFGLVIGVGLWLIGVPNPILWGIFSALMRFVPYIGAFLSALLPLALAAAVDPGWNMVLATAALFIVLEPLVGQFIEPLLYGHSTGLSPFAVLVSALFWTWLWGPVGLLLSTPLTVCLVVLGRHVDKLEFLDVLFGDRPALTPVENFYQRMLADDPDEAQELAEAILAQCSLSSYYDEVALKGLQLAATDARRGVLTESQLDRIRVGIAQLIEDLSDRDDAAPETKPTLAGRLLSGSRDEEVPCEAAPAVPDAPAPDALPEAWAREGAVLCIAGRGPLDEAASMMLAQLLGKHGFGTRVVPFEDVTRSRIGTLDAEGAQMVCISYLEISGTPAHLRYLVQRLRRRAPEAQVLVGLWPADDAVLTDPGARAALGADHYAVSLREGVEACLEAVRDAPRSAAPGEAAHAPPHAAPPGAALPAPGREPVPAEA
ncbi:MULTISPECIES: AI-2E family transporter [Methylobacterium]|jgi:predicted PurR-regulated permease PerM|uniref:AI-2E family transporter n=2 Tax=Methylobacteriaceae TaxID=119045 RepID=UPI0008E7A19B|nr:MULTISPECIES: AI-2E family transporter [Methylobacterium]MBK3396063.1 AI-2E family transporter [Methylobacterium ajmalii]MBK3410464.1 AI-2E family transporter [Methylobacterium ajmalii]MBZ6411256.1 AI-2E family transporter [Methylobacterium sp.]SFE16149.1 Predicted PurR-regulated permease PerM [Methylobacterium sp. yr596]